MSHNSSASRAGATYPYTKAHADALACGIEWITPELAKEIRGACAFPRQRAISEDHVKRLASEMARGWFLQGTPIWLCVMPDKSMYLVNGNHTLEAVAAGKSGIPLTVIYQQVKDFEEAAQAYAAFDIQRTRTWAQGAQATGIDQEVPMIQVVMSAMSFIMCDFAFASRKTDILHSRHLRFDTVKEYKRSAVLLKAAFDGAPEANVKLIRRAPVMAVALATARYQPSSSEEFWRATAHDDGLRSGHPAKALLSYLRVKTSSSDAARRKMMTAAAFAWNAYFEHRDLIQLAPGAVVNFYIAGTAWDKATKQKADLKPHNSPPRLFLGKTTKATGEVVSTAMFEG